METILNRIKEIKLELSGLVNKMPKEFNPDTYGVANEIHQQANALRKELEGLTPLAIKQEWENYQKNKQLQNQKKNKEKRRAIIRMLQKGY